MGNIFIDDFKDFINALEEVHTQTNSISNFQLFRRAKQKEKNDDRYGLE